jgi:hypothetical protein
MNIETRKIEFIQEFLKLDNEDVIIGLEKILKLATPSEYKEDFLPFTLEEFNKRIDQSITDFNNGRYISSEDLEAKIDQWN